MSVPSEMEQKLASFRENFHALRQEVGKRIVGQQQTIDLVLTALVVGGHVLVEGLPGLGKTELARSLAAVVNVGFQRIQCTSDLMPADAIGTYVIMETPQGRRTFEFQKGPLFANIVLLDQVNRAMPQDAVGPLAGDGRAGDHRLHRDLPPAGALFHHRHAEPAGPGRHLPAAAGAGGSLPAEGPHGASRCTAA